MTSPGGNGKNEHESRNDIERRVRIEEKIVSLENQVKALRESRHGHGEWLGKLNLQTSEIGTKMESLSNEVRNMGITLSSLSSQIAHIDKSSAVSKVKLGFIIAGIAGGASVIGSIITAVVVAWVIG